MRQDRADVERQAAQGWHSEEAKSV
jgi:hypothetical protein